MSAPLFRPNVTAALANRHHGGVMAALPIKLRVFAGLLLSLALAVLALLWYGHYTRRITVRGYVTTAADIRVYPSIAGVVTRVFVADGERVAPGDPLFEMNAGPLSGRSPQAGVIDALRAEHAAVDAQAAVERRRHSNRRRTLSTEIEDKQRQRELLAKRLSHARRSLALARREESRHASVAAQGYISAAELESRAARRLDEERQVAAIEYDMFTAEAERRLLDEALREADTSLDLRLAELDHERQRIATREGDAREARQPRIVAPVAGRVATVTIRSGQRIEQNTPALTLLPNTASYSVRLLLPGRALGFASAGTPVRLRYEAFPYQTFGVYEGRIQSIAASYLLPHQLEAPLTATEPVFPTTVTLDSQSIDVGGVRVSLASGMLVEADIPKERRRLLAWLLAPAMRIWQR